MMPHVVERSANTCTWQIHPQSHTPHRGHQLTCPGLFGSISHNMLDIYQSVINTIF